MKNGFINEFNRPIKKYLFNNYKYFNFILILFFAFFYKALSNQGNRRLINMDSKIHLIVRGIGEQNIFYSGFNKIPSEVYINGQKQEMINCSYYFSQEENNVTLIFEGELNSCYRIFYLCINVISIDLSEFDFSQVTDMQHMFRDCINLETINFGNINTSSAENMRSLFYNCSNLISIDVSKFDTSSVTHMGWMFFGCTSLKSIDVSNFNTKNIENMYSLFAQCKQITSLNLTNFDTSKVTNMHTMFTSCYNLKYLDISSFDTSNVKDIQAMFYNCKSLNYLNLDSFKFNNLTEKAYAFDGISPKIKYCINNTDSELKTLLDKVNVSICSDSCYDEINAKIDINDNQCLESCNINGYNYHEYKDICYIDCPEKTHISKNDSSICVDDKICQDFNESITKCIENTPEGFYFDENDGYYKICFQSCKSCYGPGNELENNCSECEINYYYLNESNSKSNCYEKCSFYYYFDESKYYCTEEKNCPVKYNKLIIPKNKCIDKCQNDNQYIFEYNNSCYEICPNDTYYNETLDICLEIIYPQTTIIEFSTTTSIINETINIKEEEIQDQIISNIQDGFKNGELNPEIKNAIENNEDYTKSYGNVTFQIITTASQKNKSNGNISTINLGDCEGILKETYHINDSLSLIIFKIDYKSPDTLMPIVGYEIYHPLNYSKLDLSYCDNTTIILSTPVTIDESKLYQHDPNSEYYTDDCSSFTTDNGTDILLTDRKKEYINNNLSLCENNCNYKEYDPDFKQSICDCKVKNNMDYISDIIKDANKLSKDFNLNESSSDLLDIYKCTKTLFSVNGLIKNISSYILSFFSIFFLFSSLMFMKCGYPSLLLDINKIINNKLKNQGNNYNSCQTRGGNMRNNTKLGGRIGIKNKHNPPPKKENVNQFKKKNNIFSGIENNNINSRGKVNFKTKNLFLNVNQGNKKNNSKVNNNRINNNSSLSKINNNIKKTLLLKGITNIKLNNFNDYEYNTFSFEEALLNDRRSCCQYYLSLLKTKHPILFAFGPIKDYNNRIIKICILFLFFSFCYSVNFVFFDEKMIHKIYEENGRYDYMYYAPYISISYGISHLLYIIIKLIFLSERNISEIRKKQTLYSANLSAGNAKRCIKIKSAIFFLLGLLFLVFFWYVLSAFGAVFQNTQIYIFENALISFCISLTHPFIFNLHPCIFRKASFCCKSGCMYKFSLFLQML